MKKFIEWLFTKMNRFIEWLFKISACIIIIFFAALLIYNFLVVIKFSIPRLFPLSDFLNTIINLKEIAFPQFLEICKKIPILFGILLLLITQFEFLRRIREFLPQERPSPKSMLSAFGTIMVATLMANALIYVKFESGDIGNVLLKTGIVVGIGASVLIIFYKFIPRRLSKIWLDFNPIVEVNFNPGEKILRNRKIQLSPMEKEIKLKYCFHLEENRMMRLRIEPQKPTDSEWFDRCYHSEYFLETELLNLKKEGETVFKLECAKAVYLRHRNKSYIYKRPKKASFYITLEDENARKIDERVSFTLRKQI